ncbi:MAG: T9SS type A sorting domain-containing protein [Ignavibacterium sp.]|nr:T9SS type A sorting domain-containing protein [Ignavibacterium sp.]MDW8374961.1 T9SS type A sorting domain-containing protein [Ignavibacteriales bacterium]
MKKYIVSFLVLISLATSLPQGSGLSIGANYIIYPSNVSQTEPFIVKHPTNKNILFATANTITFQPSFFVSEGVYTTTNGGNSWFGSDTCNGANILFHQGDPGITIDKNGVFILTRLGRQPFYGIYSHHSTDYGLNWSSQKLITRDGESLYERASIISDNNPLSPFFGRTYCTWVRLAGNFPVEFSYLDDIQQNWSNKIIVNSFNQRCSGTDIEIGLNGEVYICYAIVSSTSPFNETAIGFAKSTNGGLNWTVNNNAFEVNGITGVLPTKSNIRVNGLPRIAIDKSNSPHRGNIYIVTTQRNRFPAGNDPDIILVKSTDNGNTWSNPIRVNQDNFNNGKIQYFPAIDVDDYGGINIIYYDDRTTTSDSASVFLSRSTDGGNTWNDYKISDRNFKPIPIGGLGQGYQGDNIDLVSVENKIFPVWMDNRTGIYQIWSAPISFSPNSAAEENFSPKDFYLYQNYPNPFGRNSYSNYQSTQIFWQSPVSGHTTLKIFDVLGNEVATLVDDYKKAGKYQIDFSAISSVNGITLSSGIYFYRLQVGNFVETKKMIFIQ